jgi:hypothetical protein
MKDSIIIKTRTAGISICRNSIARSITALPGGRCHPTSNKSLIAWISL